MNINIEEFKTDFIDVNFDEILLQNNNPLINSNVYTNVKQKYFDETFYNYREYKMHLTELIQPLEIQALTKKKILKIKIYLTMQTIGFLMLSSILNL